MTNDTQKLQNLMQRVNISSFKGLSRDAGVSERQILRLRQGKLEQMRVDVLLKLSQVLKISLSELIETFSPRAKGCANSTVHSPLSSQKEIADLKTEYQRSPPALREAQLQLQLEQQREILKQEFQQSSLQLLESLLLQWPTVAQKATENPQLAAIKIVPLVQKPLERLLQEWGIQAIAPVGAEVPYNPQMHQLMAGTALPGEIVRVRYTGYLQGDKLLYRAKVSPV
ncbi:MAG TPA: nucleotide exchange factor GrpE [Nodularia sp. (in: cyanobacteria)]|nr:nucleotide exchange factor GrpE [Nodularia sp. (in: cyanobacteria)]